MRKLQTMVSAAVLALLGMFLPTDGSAQTTFEVSNNPQALIHVRHLTANETYIEVTQNRKSAAYMPVSQTTVLKDRSTGLSYKLKQLDFEYNKNSQAETYKLTFEAFLEKPESFELKDPLNPGASLYFTKVMAEGETLATNH